MKQHLICIALIAILCSITQHHDVFAWKLFAREDAYEEDVRINQSHHQLSLNDSSPGVTAGHVAAGACAAWCVYANRKDIAQGFSCLGQKNAQCV